MTKYIQPRQDVLRIVRREYAQTRFNVVCNVLASYGVSPEHREVDRVRLAVLKLANGSEDRLRLMVGDARRNYREVLLAAEYPRFAASRSSTLECSLNRRTDMTTSDRHQYLTWLDDPDATPEPGFSNDQGS